MTDLAPFESHWTQRSPRPIGPIHRPADLHEALALLAEDPARRPVAGGTDLMLELARTTGEAVELVDLTSVAGFATIGFDSAAEQIVLAGGVRHNDVVTDPSILERALPLAQACLEIGSPQLRNRATIAGNLVTASPANDTISALIALDASVGLARLVDGEIHRRSVPVENFFAGFRETVLAPGELIAEIRVPALSINPASSGRERGVWAKLGLRRAQAISVVHVGIVVRLDDSDRVEMARIALGSVAPVVERNPAGEAQLMGSRLDDVTITAAARAAAESVRPIDDGRASADYRRRGVEVTVARGLRALADNRQAERWPKRVPRLAVRSDAASGFGSPERPSVEPSSATGVRYDDTTPVTIRVDGSDVAAGGATSSLLDWLRDHAGTGTKEGCAEGECGACTVWLDGVAVMSCVVPAAQAAGSTVTTVHGLSPTAGPSEDRTEPGRDRRGEGQGALVVAAEATRDLHPVQQQLIDRFGVQCGFCTPGFVLSAAALISELDTPSREEVEFGLAGNLCRCTGYYAIIDAVMAAAESGTDRGEGTP